MRLLLLQTRLQIIAQILDFIGAKLILEIPFIDYFEGDVVMVSVRTQSADVLFQREVEVNVTVELGKSL